MGENVRLKDSRQAILSGKRKEVVFLDKNLEKAQLGEKKKKREKEFLPRKSAERYPYLISSFRLLEKCGSVNYSVRREK